MGKSLWVYRVSGGSCNNCDPGITELFGNRIIFVSNPKQADTLFITGAVTKSALPWLERIYKQMRKPHLVVAVGACACSQGLFKGGYNMSLAADKTMPVDVYILGCPPQKVKICQSS